MLPERMKYLRESNGYSQKELATMLGMGITAINNYENGNRTPSADFIEKLSELFNVSADYLLGLSEYESSDERAQFNKELLNSKKKVQIEALEKKIISCCEKHFSDLTFFPLWFDWLIDYIENNVDAFSELVSMANGNVSASELGSKASEIMGLGVSFAMALSESYLKRDNTK